LLAVPPIMVACPTATPQKHKSIAQSERKPIGSSTVPQVVRFRKPPLRMFFDLNFYFKVQIFSY
jgi:hypothetical protein